MTQVGAGQPAGDGAALLSRLNAVRDGATEFSSSYFASRELTDNWLGKGVLLERSYPGCRLVLRRDRDFFHVYHSAASHAALQHALEESRRQYAREILSADLVGRPEALIPVIAAYAKAGFSPYTRLVRMTRMRPSEPTAHPAAGDVLRATRTDVGDVLAFFERLLDRYSEQIPELDELETQADAGGILLVRKGADMGGVLVFEMQGQTAILRYWWVSDRYRAEGIGARLIRSMFHLCRDAARIVLWVIEGNENAITKYEHYGFRREGLIDAVMVRRGNTGT